MTVRRIIGHFGNWINTSDTSVEPYETAVSSWETDYFLSFDNSRTYKGGAFRGGSNFQLWKSGFDASVSEGARIFRPGSWQQPAYTGSLIAATPAAIPRPQLTDLEAYGPELYNRAKPDKPVMRLANAIYELKDIPGMLKQRFNTFDLKNIANFDLAVTFGWLPLWSDCQKLYERSAWLRSKLDQYLRDNGRPVHRRFIAENLGSEDEQPVAEYFPQFPELSPTFVTQCYAGGNRSVLSHYSKTKVWFSGEFRFWLPERGNLTEWQWEQWMITRLFSFRATPINIYRAIPWSWLIDWFGNVGDNLANLDTDVAERLVNNYAYIMRHVEVGAKLTASGQFWTGPTTKQTLTSSVSSYHSRKQRVAASPFGFRLKNEDLSPFQLNVLGALAGSRLK